MHPTQKKMSYNNSNELVQNRAGIQESIKLQCMFHKHGGIGKQQKYTLVHLRIITIT